MNTALPLIGREYPKRVIPYIKNAKKTIFAIVYDWKWYPTQMGSSIQIFNQEIVRKAKQGIKVKVILNDRKTASILEKEGVKTKVGDLGGLVHAKMLLIDDDIAIIGSHNFTYNAFETNFEISILSQDRAMTKDLTDYFLNLWR